MAITATEIQQLYVAYFNRPADALGLPFWQARANATSLATVANDFANSDEYKSTYAGKTAAEQVNAIYNNLFGRDAEPAGLLFWAGKLLAGTETFGSIALTIARAAQNEDKVAIDAKLAAAVAYTDALDTTDEIVGYSGEAANAVAREWLKGIVDTATQEAATTEAALTAVINAAVDAHDNVTGTPVSLNAGADTLNGTAGNDVFNALTVKADGTAATTFSDFDAINGGAGSDTLNIYTTNANNTGFPSSATVKNVETINIYNAGTAAALGDASKFVGATALWQINAAATVTNLEATTTAGLRNIAAAGTTIVEASDAAATANVALDNVAEGYTLTVRANAGGNGTLAAVNVSGTVADTDKNGAVANTNVAVTVGADVQTLTVNTAVATALSITNGAGTKAISTINASASTGAITYADSETTVASITTGSGKDNVTLVTVTAKDNAATAIDETVNAVVNTGAGNDKITINTTGDGKVSVVAGDGNDTVAITGRGTAALDVNLGAGDDVFTSGVAIAATDKIDAGAGSDTLLLNLVGSANVGAFSNFDAFDAKSLAKTLDIEILSQKNTVSEIVTTGDVGASAVLTNVGSGVGYRVKADTTVANALTITQKTAGELVITHDIDETGTSAATTTATDADAAVITNATSLKAVFDSTFVGKVQAADDNVASLSITAADAKTLAIVSGGTVDVNDVNIVSAAKLETITITGASKTNIDVTSAAKLATIDGSAATGGLTTSTASVIDGGSIKLGTGADIITLAVSSGTVVESLVGFEKAAAAAAGTDVAAAAAAIEAADLLAFAGQVANTASVTGGELNAKGVLTFTGAGPATIDAALVIANAAAETNGEALVFEYTGNTYVFVQGATDSLVQLTGVTGVTNLVEGAGGLLDHFAVV